MRPSRTFHMVQRLESLFAKRIGLYATTSGYVGLYRADDGQAYEVEIRPACLSRHFTEKTKGKKKGGHHGQK